MKKDIEVFLEYQGLLLKMISLLAQSSLSQDREDSLG